MTNLSGTLDGIGLPALVRFLTGLGQTGRLRITFERWTGELTFAAGEVVAASLGKERGLDALKAIALALAGGRFTFTITPHAVEREIELRAPELNALLDTLTAQSAALAGVVPSLAAVPRLAMPASGAKAAASGQDAADQTRRLLLRRSALRTLLAIDGQRSVVEFNHGRRLARTLEDLATLAALDLVVIPALPGPSVPPAEPGCPQSAAPAAAGGRAMVPDAEEVGTRMAPPSAAAARPAAATETAVPPAAASTPGEAAAALPTNGPAAAPDSTPQARPATAGPRGRPDQTALRYWLRALFLALLAAVLLALTWWNTSRTAGTRILGLPAAPAVSPAADRISTVRVPPLYKRATVPQPAAPIMFG